MRFIKKMIAILVLSLFLTSTFTGEEFLLPVHAMTEEDSLWVQQANEDLIGLLSEREVMAVVYLCEQYDVKTAPDYSAANVVTVPSGQTVFLSGVMLAQDGEIWMEVSLSVGEAQYNGYIQREYLAVSDEHYLEWENRWGYEEGGEKLLSITVSGNDKISSYGKMINQFPTSYRPALDALKQKHPNWIFVPMNTGLDWNTVINNELQGGKSLVQYTYPVYDREGAYDDNRWFYASREILELYMDPRNSLTEDAIFQFEQLTYNESYHTKEALQSFLNQTFMNDQKKAPETDMTYADIFYAIGKADLFKVSPFHLAARVYQEQGKADTPLISGTYPGYEHLYNHFNIGATGKTSKEVIINGLTYARNAKSITNPNEAMPWNNAYYSILGGSYFISANYIRKGQDSLYLQKFNVNPSATHALYTHQYMQNIAAPTSEAKKVKQMYAGANSLDCAFVFTIPVFKNMPANPCPVPTASKNVVLKVPAGFDGSTVYLDGAAFPAEFRNGYTIVKAPTHKYTTAVVYKYNENRVPVDMYVWTLAYMDTYYEVTEQPGLQNLLTYHGFSIRITGKAGIRFKTGISTGMRAELTNAGVNGLKLKEYGTLVMNKANMDKYPLVKGGTKVSSGMSYGYQQNGAFTDSIYETVNDRYRFTSVLVGIPATQYRTEFAFRGYAVLEKEGKQYIIYGPYMAKSIYSLADQVISMGTYSQGSAADQFLRKIIADAGN